MLFRSLVDWAAELLQDCEAIARRLDALDGGEAYQAALAAAQAKLAAPDSLPSARVLQEATGTWRGEVTVMTAALSQASRRALLSMPLPPERALHWAAVAARSLDEQREIEATQQGSFEDFLVDYLSPAGLHP